MLGHGSEFQHMSAHFRELCIGRDLIEVIVPQSLCAFAKLMDNFCLKKKKSTGKEETVNLFAQDLGITHKI